MPGKSPRESGTQEFCLVRVGIVDVVIRLKRWRAHPLTHEGIFGAADGLGITLGIVAGLIVSHQASTAVWAAAVSSGVAEFFSMANGERLADARAGWTGPLVIGIASLLGCVVPAIPYAAWHGPGALALSLALAAAVAGLISWLRPEHGAAAIIETYALLVITGMACAIVGLLI
jgi:VIT1/CCC1 family predicted Fe2+/Mn2+ transporter